MTQDAFDRAEKEGRISAEFDHEAFIAEVQRQVSLFSGTLLVRSVP